MVALRVNILGLQDTCRGYPCIRIYVLYEYILYMYKAHTVSVQGEYNKALHDDPLHQPTCLEMVYSVKYTPCKV